MSEMVVVLVRPSHVTCSKDLSYLRDDLVGVYVLAHQVLSNYFSPQVQLSLLLNRHLTQRKIEVFLMEPICRRALKPHVYM